MLKNNEFNLNFIFSLENSIWIFKDNKFIKLLDDFGVYGITWSKRYFYYATYNKLCKYNFDLKLIDTLIFSENPNLHQILYYNNNLHVTKTSFNQIYIYNEDFHKISQINFGDKKEDISHLNSIFIYKDLTYVCHHNLLNPSFVTIGTDVGKISFIDHIGNMNHNVFVDGRKLYTLNSDEGEIIIYDIRNNKRNKIKINFKELNIPLNYCFLRGLASTKTHMLIGTCLKGEKNERKKGKSYIIVVEKKSMKMTSLDIPETSQIREIRIIDQIDYAHNKIKLSFNQECFI